MMSKIVWSASYVRSLDVGSKEGGCRQLREGGLFPSRPYGVPGHTSVLPVVVSTAWINAMLPLEKDFCRGVWDGE